MTNPIRFHPPASHPQAVLLGIPVRPDGLEEDQWETLRGTQIRRDRKLFAAIVMSALTMYETHFSFGPVMSDADLLHEWSELFESAVDFDGALELVCEAAPPEPGCHSLWSLVACVSPELLGDCLADPVGFRELASGARSELAQAEKDVQTALELVRPMFAVPDHVPAEWGAQS